MLANAARVQQDTDTPGTSHQAHSPRGTALPKVGQRKQEVTGKNRRLLLLIKREEEIKDMSGKNERKSD